MIFDILVLALLVNSIYDYIVHVIWTIAEVNY